MSDTLPLLAFMGVMLVATLGYFALIGFVIWLVLRLLLGGHR